MKRRHLEGLLLMILWLLVIVVPAWGARIAGDEGITPTTTDSPASSARDKAPSRDAMPAPETETPAPGPAIRATPSPNLPSLQQAPARGTPTVSAPGVRVKAAQDAAQAPVNEPVSGNGDNRFVTIDFDNVDLPVFIKFISELTGKNFVIDNAVRGKVTIVSPTRISIDEAYRVFESILEVHGFAAVPAGNITKIVPTASARSMSVETRLRAWAVSAEDKVVTQLVPLKYADPEELKKLFTPLISKNSVMASYPPARTLIVTDVLSNIERLLRITKAIDVEGVGEEISVIPLRHAMAANLAKSLETVFQKNTRRAKAPQEFESEVRIVPDERTNAVVVLASEDDTRKIKQLVKLLDTETPRGEGSIHVYYLQHATAEDLTKVLTTLPSKQSGEAEKGKTPVISKETRIVADKATNSLVIMANKDDYLVLEGVIQKLDIPRAMVYIEALIMEVNVEKDFSLGVEWEGIKTFSYDGKNAGVFGGSSSGDFPYITSAVTKGALTQGFSLGIISDVIEIAGIKFPNLAAVAHAYRQDKDINILSTPQLLTTDNEEAEIMVGKNIPYITSKNTSAAQVDYTNYEYKDVGVSMKVTPQISQERFVRLKIHQEVMRLISTVETENQPSTYKRMAQTTVIVKDGNTVVIGGLIGDETTHIDYNVPCLSNIPLIDWLFKSTSKRIEKTNLYVFLTPRIIQNPDEAKKIYEDKKDRIDTIKEGVIKLYERPGPEGAKP